MTDPRGSRKKKKKITHTASLQGVEKAEQALKRLGFESKSNFANSQLISRSVVTKFFNRQPIQLDSLKRICNALELSWKEIAGIIEEEQLSGRAEKDCSSPDINKGVEQVQTLHRQVTVIDKQNGKNKAVITLNGDINSVQNFKIIESILREYSGDTIKITDIKEGSIKLTIEGSQEDIERLVERIRSGELTEVNGFPVEDIQILSESSDGESSNELDDKWHLVQEIVNQKAKRRDLSNTDLSDANLRGANLRGANLRGADLTNADLEGVNLSGNILIRTFAAGINAVTSINAITSITVITVIAVITAITAIAGIIAGNDLIRIYIAIAIRVLSEDNLHNAYLFGANLEGANLEGANLHNANLEGANLEGANLEGANLEGAKVKNARFRHNQGISEQMKLDLIQQGAIFDDSPGEHSKNSTCA